MGGTPPGVISRDVIPGNVLLGDVTALPEFRLTARTPAGAACVAAGMPTYRAAARCVGALPYGRPGGRDLPAVVREGRGTWSGKHAVLARLAHEHGRDDVALVVGLYLMCEANTPGAGPVLAAHGLEAVPEARCYLRVGDVRRVDLTGVAPGAESPFAALLEEHVVAPGALAVWKASYHRRALARWARGWGFDPDAVWAAREACVAAHAGGPEVLAAPNTTSA